MTGGPWMVRLPPGLELITANQRMHWAKRARLTRAIRQTACWQAKAAKIPQLDRAHVIAEYRPPDRRRRDPANWYPAVKAAIDGLTDAGLWPDDDAEHVIGPDMRLGAVVPRGQLVLIIHPLDPASEDLS